MRCVYSTDMQDNGVKQMGWIQSLRRQLNAPVRLRVWAVVVPAFTVYVQLLLLTQSGLPTSERLAQSVHGLITVQCEIEAWTRDSEQFPIRIEPLMARMDPYQTPMNYYQRGRRLNRPMRLVDLGSRNYSGNYSYIPALRDNTVVGYYLLVYGNVLTPGHDVDADGIPDHVVHVLDSNDVRGNLLGCWLGRERELPPLSEAIAQWREFREAHAGLWEESAYRPRSLQAHELELGPAWIGNTQRLPGMTAGASRI